MYFQKSASGFKRQRKCYWKWDCRFVLLNVHQTRKQSTCKKDSLEDMMEVQCISESKYNSKQNSTSTCHGRDGWTKDEQRDGSSKFNSCAMSHVAATISEMVLDDLLVIEISPSTSTRPTHRVCPCKVFHIQDSKYTKPIDSWLNSDFWLCGNHLSLTSNSKLTRFS